MGDRVTEKVAIVTGAGSAGPGWGNGKAAAVLYAREGARVLAVDIDPAAAEETRRIVAEEGGTCSAAQVDVTDADAVRAMVAQATDRYGRIDILHNNVGITEVGGPEEISEEAWERMLTTNVTSMFLTCKHCIPHMVRQGGGAIVNISSISSIRYTGYPSVSYNASKGAVNQLTQSIALQYADRGIRANCVLPGLMHTPMIERYITGAYGGSREEMIRRRDAMVPMKRMGTAWDVAYAALFLASDDARYITGAQLVVDGGVTCKFS